MTAALAAGAGLAALPQDATPRFAGLARLNATLRRTDDLRQLLDTAPRDGTTPLTERFLAVSSAHRAWLARRGQLAADPRLEERHAAIRTDLERIRREVEDLRSRVPPARAQGLLRLAWLPGGERLFATAAIAEARSRLDGYARRIDRMLAALAAQERVRSALLSR